MSKKWGEHKRGEKSPRFFCVRGHLWDCDFSVVSGGNSSRKERTAIGQVVDQRACCLVRLGKGVYGVVVKSPYTISIENKRKRGTFYGLDKLYGTELEERQG